MRASTWTQNNYVSVAWIACAGSSEPAFSCATPSHFTPFLARVFSLSSFSCPFLFLEFSLLLHFDAERGRGEDRETPVKY